MIRYQVTHINKPRHLNPYINKKRNIYDIRDKRNAIFQARPHLYSDLIFPMWIVLSVLLTLITYYKGTQPDIYMGHPIMANVAWFVLFLNIIYFYLVCQDICYVIRYQYIKKKDIATEKRTLSYPFPNSKEWSKQLISHHKRPKVALIYCTYNDFLPDCLYQCMTSQTYPVDVKILDDSTKSNYQNDINAFANLHPNHVQVIRRVKHSNDKNKAGNLNHGLKVIEKQHYDFYVFLDSDELLEPKFVYKMLKMFYYGNKYGYHIGLIQATHYSGRNINHFMSMNALSAAFFWNTQNVVRSAESGIRAPRTKNHKATILKAGDSTCSNLGHGCMADANALYKSGLFPNVVSEDVGSTMYMLQHGYNVYFASQIQGNEETITDMNAMKIRCTKFANGDLQFLRKFRHWICHTKMESTLQKMDTFKLMGSTNISAFLYCSVFFYSVWFPLEHSLLGTSIIFLIPIILFLYSSGIIDTLYSLTNLSILHTIRREFEVLATFSSTYYLSVKATYGQLILHHKAKFNVTPKGVAKIHWYDAIKDNMNEMIFSISTIVIALSVAGWSSWMILLAYVPPLFSPLAELMVNNQSKKQKKFQKILKVHQNQALHYKVVPEDKIWKNWRI